MTSMRGICTSVALTLLLAGACGRRVNTVRPLVPTRSAESFYADGLAAFHLGTPEGYTQAADAFRRASALKPEQCEYALNLAQSLLFLAAEQLLNWEEYEPRQTEAGSVVDSADTKCRPSHEPFVLRLRALIAGRGPAATELINRAIELDTTDAMNWVVLGYLDPASGRLVTTEGAGRWIAMMRAVEIQPESALIQYEAGKNYQVTRGKEMEARRAFERAIELSPRHFRAYLGLAFSADDSVDVEPLYQKVVEIAPNFLEGRIALGSYYASLEEIEKAAAQYSAAIAINPKYENGHFRLGQLMLHVERPTDAEQHFKTVVELNSGNYEAYYYLGNISYGRGEYEDARTRYEQALKNRVNYAEAEYGIGWVYRQRDQVDVALTQFEKVVRINSRYGDAYLSRGDIRAERRQFREALIDYGKAIEVYEQQIKGLNATIALAEARPQSRMMQAEKKRAERDKSRVEAVLERARRYQSEVEDLMKKVH